MQATSQFRIDVHVDPKISRKTMADEVREGLTREPKQLPSKYFYDKHGSQLFERITELPEYYLTRTEQALLENVADHVARVAEPADLVELGSGSAKKTRLLIEAGRDAGTLQRYVPVEVSKEMAEESARGLAEDYPDLNVHAVVADFEHHLEHVPEGEQRLVAFLGSTIGNFPKRDAIEFLRGIPQLLERGGYFLLGTDLVKNKSVLEAAYNDSQGVTAQFNRNILNVINDRLDGDFDPDTFAHHSFFNTDKERIETYLRSRDEQSARLDAIELDVAFEKDERVRTEISCKYTRRSVEKLLDASGLVLEHWFTDPDESFALSLSVPA